MPWPSGMFAQCGTLETLPAGTWEFLLFLPNGCTVFS